MTPDAAGGRKFTTVATDRDGVVELPLDIKGVREVEPALLVIALDLYSPPKNVDRFLWFPLLH